MSDPSTFADRGSADKAPGKPRFASVGLRRVGAAVPSFLAGAVVALVLYYMLYRIGLPLQPFVYVAF